jgi:hypothetical protein
MKWYGEIGFKELVEVERGVWEPQIVPRNFFGDVLKDAWREQPADKINTDLRISNRLSVVADQYLQNNFHKIAYVTFGGAKWTVSGVEVNYPRLTLDLGSLYVEEAGEEINEDEG